MPIKPLKPFSEYGPLDWTDVPVEGCGCAYCVAYVKAHPNKTYDWGLPPSHSLEIADAFGGKQFTTDGMGNVVSTGGGGAGGAGAPGLVFTTESMNISMDEIVASFKSDDMPKPKKLVTSTGSLDCIKEKGFKMIYLIRGIPGSGKSTLAALVKYAIAKCGWSTYSFEADTFFVNPTTNEYVFNAEKLGEAHSQCQASVERVMSEEKGVVIVSNTFVYRAHLEPYLKMARKYGYTPIEYVCRGNFQNVHGVPPDVMRKMKLNFEI